MATPGMIAVDWGTSRFRAWLVGGDGAILAETASDDGIMSVPPGAFPATLRRLAGPWLAGHPGLPVATAGMVGSQNGWVEAPYLDCPATAQALAAAAVTVGQAEGLPALIVPGLRTRDPAGIPDVMRGEEVKIVGCGLHTGTVVTPGTHSKWSQVAAGAIQGFTSYMTGDAFAALRDHTILSRLLASPPDPAGFARGLALAARPGALTHKMFAARTLVLAGEMPGAQAGPFLSGLLIGAEVADGLAAMPPGNSITLVADGTFAEFYGQALAAHGRAFQLVAPDAAFIAGLRALVAARPAPGPLP